MARCSCNSRHKTSGTDATATTASSTNHDVPVPPPPRLPPIDPSPNRMFTAIRQSASAVVATIASPFCHAAGLPILAINSSPSASVGLSELTHHSDHSDEVKESEESIRLLAAADLAEKGEGADSNEEGEEMRLSFACAAGVDEFASAEVDLDSDHEGEEIFSIPGSPAFHLSWLSSKTGLQRTSIF